MNKLAFLEKVAALARIGINLTESYFDKDRYQQILELCKEGYVDETGIDKSKLHEIFKNEIGYITPKVGVNAIIFNENLEVLVELRTNDSKWGLPGGWTDMGESPQTCIIRELKEETGFDIEITNLLDIFWRNVDNDFPFSSYHLVYLCRIISGELSISPESYEVAFRPFEQVNNWHRDHGKWVQVALNQMNKKDPL